MGESLKIVVIGLVGIGDMVYFLPALKLLRSHHPSAEITLVLPDSANYISLFGKLPEIDSIQAIPYPIRFPPPPALLRAIFALRKLRADISIWPFAAGSWKKQVGSYLVHAKRRLLHAGSGGQFLNNVLNEALPNPHFKFHAVDIHLSLLKPLGIQPATALDRLPRIFLSPSDRTEGRALLPMDCGLKGWIGFHPVCKLAFSATRLWPSSYWVQLAESFLADGYGVALVGSPGERDWLDRIYGALPSDPKRIRILAIPDLSRTVAAMAGMKLFVGNNSSLIQLANAIPIPVIGIYGSSDFNYTGPLGALAWVIRCDLPCSPCWDDPRSRRSTRCRNAIPYQCLTHLKPELVYEHAIRVLASPAAISSNINRQPQILHLSVTPGTMLPSWQPADLSLLY